MRRVRPAAPFVLLDDARAGAAPARLYSRPVAVLEAWTDAEVQQVMAALRNTAHHAAGFLSYEAAGAFEPRAALPRGATPLAWFGLFDGWEEVDAATWLPDPAGAAIALPQPRVTQGDYAAMFARVQALIEAGDLYQANLTFRGDLAIAGDPLSAYARLRGTTRAGWSAIVDTGRDLLLSFSPELFFALSGGRITCSPMKGTARREADPVADTEAARALTQDEKQRAENLMIVDLMRNDLSRIARVGSVAVPDLFSVERYPTVHQMTSTVTAELDAASNAVDVLAALFPCGSITGAPKIRAIEALAAIERDPRGIYTGAIGRIDAGGMDAQFNVAIRTLHLPDGADTATYGIGGGIVADSRMEAEWDEALAKAAFMTHDARVFDLIETMAFDPIEGVALIEGHLARMKASAAALGFVFDRHGARNELQAATFRLREAATVRLLLARSGALAIEVGPAPAPPGHALRVGIVPLPVDERDIRLRHKTSDRGFYDEARKRAGADEVLFVTPDGCVTEGSFTNVFVARDGMLVTPPLAHGLLPGVLRAALIADGRAREETLMREDLAGGFVLGNALRGLMPAQLAVA